MMSSNPDFTSLVMRIVETTLESFGTVQLKRYATQIESAIRELEETGNNALLLKARPDIRP
ncbi:MAG: hypothetical protein HLX50_00125 [Alteromonadaceae bacterium]|nr:hypothetical protein [Alteromonadaceae bacterium]